MIQRQPTLTLFPYTTLFRSGKMGKPVINFTANFGATGPADYRKRWGTDAYLQHRQDWLTKNTYGVNPETGEYEAYQTGVFAEDRKSTRLNSSHVKISYAVFC